MGGGCRWPSKVRLGESFMGPMVEGTRIEGDLEHGSAGTADGEWS